MKVILAAVILFVLAVVFAAPHMMVSEAAGPAVDVVTVKGVINPVSSGYIRRGLDAAEASGADAFVIELDTPGGLDSSMREIIQRILSAQVPVVVYISPAGARAASAGLFVLVSGHVAAMAPNTSTGAAHPVAGGGQEITGDMKEKVTNDAVGYIKGLATRRNRNAEWVERAVRESIVVTSDEAVNLRVADLSAPNIESLLTQLNDREVELASGPVTIHTSGAAIRRIEMDSIEQFLYTISDPTIAYILLSVAMSAIFLELSNPGAILPGIVGGISLFLAVFALGMLPINYAGVGLLLFAFLLFLAEVKVQSHGMLVVGGIISMTLGSLMLVNSSAPELEISRTVIAMVVVATAMFFLFVIGTAIRAQRRDVVTGVEGLVGHRAIARTDLKPTGFVLAEGELWEAIAADDPVACGEAVIIGAVDGLKLRVSRADRAGAATAKVRPLSPVSLLRRRHNHERV